MGLRSRLALESSIANESEDRVTTNHDLQPVQLDSPERTWTWPRYLIACTFHSHSIIDAMIAASSASGSPKHSVYRCTKLHQHRSLKA